MLGDKFVLTFYCGTVITQCSMRHLYTLSDIPQSRKDTLIATAKTMERRRCNHHTLDKPLSTLECLSSVIDPKKAGVNKAHVVVASQEEEIRRWCRGIQGIPLVYVKRSVMIMEPMTDSSVSVREGIERGKFRTGLRGRLPGAGAKRKRKEEGSEPERDEAKAAEGDHQVVQRAVKKKIRGPKGPNPLSVKKPKKEKADDRRKPEDDDLSIMKSVAFEGTRNEGVDGTNIIEGPVDEAQNPSIKRKRKRKHKADTIKELEKELDGQQPDVTIRND